MATNIDSYQLMTLIFGAAIIVTAIVRYNDPSLENHLQQFITALALSLGFLFAGYAVILTSNGNSKALNMYKWFIVIVTILAWLLVVWTGISPGSGWKRVQDDVALPLAQGSLFALPVALI